MAVLRNQRCGTLHISSHKCSWPSYFSSYMCMEHENNKWLKQQKAGRHIRWRYWSRGMMGRGVCTVGLAWVLLHRYCIYFLEFNVGFKTLSLLLFTLDSLKALYETHMISDTKFMSGNTFLLPQSDVPLSLVSHKPFPSRLGLFF